MRPLRMDDLRAVIDADWDWSGDLQQRDLWPIAGKFRHLIRTLEAGLGRL